MSACPAPRFSVHVEWRAGRMRGRLSRGSSSFGTSSTSAPRGALSRALSGRRSRNRDRLLRHYCGSNSQPPLSQTNAVNDVCPGQTTRSTNSQPPPLTWGSFPAYRPAHPLYPLFCPRVVKKSRQSPRRLGAAPCPCAGRQPGQAARGMVAGVTETKGWYRDRARVTVRSREPIAPPAWPKRSTVTSAELGRQRRRSLLG